jgi:predicted small metal-binding protein
MMLELRCGDVVTGCDGVVQGATREQVLTAAAAHAESAHGLTTIDEDTERMLVAAIHDA